MSVLQSSTDSLHILQGSSCESHLTSSDRVCNLCNMEFQEGVDLKEEGFIAVNEEADTSIKQEETPEDINFPDIKSEPNEVSYVCMSVIRHILPVSSNVGGFCDVSISGHFKHLHIWE